MWGFSFARDPGDRWLQLIDQIKNFRYKPVIKIMLFGLDLRKVAD
jgi:hypothetical protein